jgi:Protein of unknown function (DUF551)
MNECSRCGKPNPAEFHTCTPSAVVIREAYLKGMADGAEGVSRWISVKDQFPEECEEVLFLCTNETGKKEIMTGHKEDGIWHHCCCFYSTMALNDLVMVTHWMPIPGEPHE